MGVIADGLCIIESVLNVRQAFLVRNNMQAYAYMGATAVSVASLVFTIKGTITVSAAIGTGTGGVGLVVLKAIWPLLILAALAIFFVWWTASLAFTPLVTFYANYLFNKKGIAELGSLMSPTKFKQVEEVQIDTLDHLLNPKTW